MSCVKMANIAGSRDIRPVKLNKDVLDLLLGLLVDVLLVVGHQGLRECLSDGIHLQKAHDILSQDPVRTHGLGSTLDILSSPTLKILSNLASVATTLDTDPDVNVGKPESRLVRRQDIL